MIVGVKVRLSRLRAWEVPRAELELRQFWTIIKRSGPTDHIRDIVVVRNIGTSPAALSWDPEEETFRCSLLLSLDDEYFGTWGKKNKVHRFLWLLEQYFISLETRKDVEAGLSAMTRFNASPSPPTTVASLVLWGRAVYAIQKQIDEVVRGTLVDDNGRPAETDGALDQAMERVRAMLGELPGAIDNMLGPVRRGDTSQEIPTWLSCSMIVSILVNELAALCAHFDERSDWQWIQARLYEIDNFTEVIGDLWPSMHADWRGSLIRGRQVNRQPSPEMTAAINLIFLRLGICILDEPRGISVLEFLPAKEIQTE